MKQRRQMQKGKEPVYFVSDGACAFSIDSEDVSLSVAGRSVEDIVGIMVFLLSFEKTKQFFGKISEEDLKKGKEVFGFR